jgi:lysophospholipase L1-like esterase
MLTESFAIPAPLQGSYYFAGLPSGASIPLGTPASTIDQGTVYWNGTLWQSSPLVLYSPTSTPTGSGISNYSAQNTAYTRAAIGRVIGGTGSMKVACIGDSTTTGSYATPGNQSAGNRPFGYPSQLANILTARGLPAHSDSFFGSNNVIGGLAPYLLYNTKVTSASGFSVGPTTSLGGPSFQSTAIGGVLSFTPTTAFDTIDIYWLPNSGYTATVNVDGGSTLATITGSPAGVFGHTQITGVTHGTHTINITQATGTGVFVGVAVTDSTTPRVEVYNMGISSGFVNDAASAALSVLGSVAVNKFGFYAGIPVVAPDLVTINLTINDTNTQQATVAAYQAALQSAVVFAQATSDVILMIGNPCNTAPWTGGVIAPQYQAAVYAVAQTCNVPVCDITQRWTSYAVTNPIMPYGDTGVGSLHPSQVGYADIARALSSFFL